MKSWLWPPPWEGELQLGSCSPAETWKPQSQRFNFMSPCLCNFDANTSMPTWTVLHQWFPCLQCVTFYEESLQFGVQSINRIAGRSDQMRCGRNQEAHSVFVNDILEEHFSISLHHKRLVEARKKRQMDQKRWKLQYCKFCNKSVCTFKLFYHNFSVFTKLCRNGTDAVTVRRSPLCFGL